MYFQKVPLLHQIIIFFFATALSPGWATAQKPGKILAPHDNYGILAGYHLRKGGNVIELGLSNFSSVHGLFFGAQSLSMEYTRTEADQNLFGLTAGFWYTCLLSAGVSATIYSDFRHLRSFSLKPMLGLGVMGVQVVYEYDLQLVRPNFDFGSRHRLAFRLNIPVIHPDSKDRAPKF